MRGVTRMVSAGSTIITKVLLGFLIIQVWEKDEKIANKKLCIGRLCLLFKNKKSMQIVKLIISSRTS